jgi:ATP-dependent Lon protease
MLPMRNQRDLDDIPADARAQVDFVWMNEVDDALATALSPLPTMVHPA